MKFILLLLVTIFSTSICKAQKKYATITGSVVSANDNPIPNVSVTILGRTNGITTSDSGTFTLKVPATLPFALVYSKVGYSDVQQNFLLSVNETEYTTVILAQKNIENNTVTVYADPKRNDISTIKINPKYAFVLPSPTGGIEGMLKVYVGSNNELTSQYSVRGGNYDENLIYVNDFEIYRPYLVSNGQQEGLSFINAQLTQNVDFQLGGFQAKYGDKMSSVLDVQYRKPKAFGGSVYISLLEQGVHLEGVSRNNKFTYLLGARNRNNRNLLSSQETKGNYQPSSNDVQSLITYTPNPKTTIEALVNLSQTKFTLIPEFTQKTTSVFSPVFSANLGLDVFFEGAERDVYNTNMIGINVKHKPTKALTLKLLASSFNNTENENYDILGAYQFGDRDFDKTKPTFGQIINTLGVGIFQNYARNQLQVQVSNLSHKGTYSRGKNYLQWGLGIDHTSITDKLQEFELHDSAGYTLPLTTTTLQLKRVLNSNIGLSFSRLTGYIQNNYSVGGDSTGLTLQAGLRYNYSTLNQQLLIQPRLSMAYKPTHWKRNFIFKVAAGAYAQPPFYRELRLPNGTVNTQIRAQQSYHFITAADYNFVRRSRPYKFTAEAYYKAMPSIIPYDVDNVRIRYQPNIPAKAYAMGAEFRLFGELVKDAESWVSLGIMQTKENLTNDFFTNYKNAAGEVITRASTDRIVTDSVRQNIGWLRRPTDRLITFGLFFSDYLATNKNLKVYINTITGTNMPYNLPDNPKYRNGLLVDPYLRVDLGFSALIIDAERSKRRSHAPLQGINNMWLNIEVFNLIDRRNQISFLFIKDYANNTFSIPNRLTPRLLNVKLMARF